MVTGCIVQKLYKVNNKSGHVQEKNERGCPLLSNSLHIQSIPSADVLCPVSIVHNCDSRCTLESKRKRRMVERENITTNTLVLKHDFNNEIFALNIYCLNNAYSF